MSRKITGPAKKQQQNVNCLGQYTGTSDKNVFVLGGIPFSFWQYTSKHGGKKNLENKSAPEVAFEIENAKLFFKLLQRELSQQLFAHLTT